MIAAPPGLAFLVPGGLDQLTGGYIFDRRIVEGLRASGRAVAVVELAGSYPDADAPARGAVADALAALPDGAVAVIDGLALLGAADCLAAAARRLRLVAFVHHPLASETGLDAATSARFAALEAALLRQLRGAICPSEATAAALRHYGLVGARIAIVPPGTDKPAGGATSIAPAPPLETGLRLLSVATITPRKGHRVLVAALATLADLAWRLRCVGSLTRDPAAAAALRRDLAASGVGERVILVGERSPAELASEYRAADCFILPSFHEGYGMAFAEALAHGMPIVASRAGAVPDTVPDSAGLLVPAGDVAALAAALRRIIVDERLRRRLAAGAREAGAALPDWRQSVASWAAALDRLVASDAVYRDLDQGALDAQYNLRAAVPAHPAYFARWAAESAAVRARAGCRRDLAYGDAPAETLDLFPAGGTPAPLLVFLHGGYWQAMDKSDFSFVAPAYLAAGIGVAVVNYTLAPAAGMDAIVGQIRRAVAFLARAAASLGVDRERIFLVGHSAGGHLTAMAMLTDWSRLGLAGDPIRGGCALSGIFDLEPIRLCYLNKAVALDAATARRNSPLHLLATAPPPRGALILAVGGRETAEFHRQQAEFAAACRARRWRCHVVDQPDEEHFSIVDRLAERGSTLHAALVAAITQSR